jgi:hypothetical protein
VAFACLTTADLDRLLDPREQKVLRLKFGLEDGRAYNNHEVKIELGVGDERGAPNRGPGNLDSAESDESKGGKG